MPEEETVPLPREVRNPAADFRHVIHWVTHVRKRGLGMWAWLLQRITGVLMVFGAVVHVLANHWGYTFPGGTLLTDDLLLFCGAYHAFNGIRVVLIEAFGWAAEREDKLFIGVLVATVLFMVYWAYAVGL